MNKKLNWFAWFSVVVVGVISSVKIIHEPDLWWQIRTGQWIMANKAVPKVDVFSYTFLGESWINVKWFAEVLMASVSDLFGAEWLVLLQILCTVLILHYCFKLSKSLASKIERQNITPSLGIMLAGLILLFTINYRMNSRPEMFSHALVIIFLYYLFSYSKSNSKWLFIIIPLQILWTNTHEAYGMGIVLILIFLVGHWLEFLIFKKDKPLKLSLVALVAILSSAINPNGFKMIAHPFNIFGQLSDNKFTTELLGFTDGRYWQYQSFLMLFVFSLCLFFLLRKNGKKSFDWKGIITKFGLPYILIFFAFFYLALTAFRNIPFFLIICTPLLACFIDSALKPKNRKPYYVIIGLSLFFYGMLASNVFYNKLLPNEQFGIGVNAEKTPIGATKFLKENKIEGKGFVDYFTSAYFLYELQPEYQSYIDLRDLDVFNSDFFKNTFTVYQTPNAQLANGKTLWQFFKELDDFNYVVLLNNDNFKNLNKHLVHADEEFELVYADDLNSIYLKKNTQNQILINQYGFANGKNDVYHDLASYQNSALADTFTTILWPFNNTKTGKEFTVLRDAYYGYIGVQ